MENHDRDKEKGKKRNRGLDCMKGILVWGMILAHCFQFFGREERFPQNYLVNFMNLHVFSGFLLAFGYVSYRAYYQKERKAATKKMLAHTVKMLFAFYLSGICFYALAEHKLFRTDLILELLLIQRYPGWSEFLIAFGAFMVVGVIFFHFFRKMDTKRLLAAGIVSGAACLIPGELIKIPQLAMLAGSAHYVTFPVLPYLICYCLGIWLSREAEGAAVRVEEAKDKNIILGMRRLNVLTLATAILSLPALLPFFLSAELPGRFPPEAAYPFGSLFFLVCLYRLCRRLPDLSGGKRYQKFISYLSGVGRQSLFYLIISNMIIFAFSASPFSYRNWKYALGFAFILMAVLYYLGKLAESGCKKLE